METPLPFLLNAVVTKTVSDTPITIQVIGVDVEGLREHVRSAVTLFRRAAELGMFSEFAPPSASSSLVLKESKGTKDIRYTGTVANLPPGGFRVLLNLLIVCHHTIGGFRAAHVTATAETGRTWRGEELLSAPYPGRRSSLPFFVEVDDEIEFVTDPVIRIRFRRPPDKEFETIKEQLKAWDTLIMEGGVWGATLPDAPPVYPVATYRLSPHVVEHTLSGFMAPVDAYSLLVNMLAKLDQTLCPVEALEIS